jgi:hypothetical protein
MVASILLLGLPGAILYQAFSALEQRGGFQAVKPDAAWPIALMLSILWPWGVPVAYWFTRRVGAPKRKSVAVLLGEFVWLSIICFFLSVVPE